MTTANDLIEATRRQLLSGYREEQNLLNADINSSVTTLVTTDTLTGTGLQAGAVIDLDLELMYVRSVNEGTSTVTVIRGWLGSTAAAHVAATATPITVNPKFPRVSILAELNNDLRSLSAPLNGLYQVQTADLTYSATVSGYDLTGATDVIGIVEVSYKVPDGAKLNPLVPQGLYRLERKLATADFPSGMALILKEGGYPGQAVRVRYKAPYNALATLADNVLTNAGLHTEAHDIPPLGARMALVGDREIRRDFYETSSDPGADQGVPVGAHIGTMRMLAARRDKRIAEEAARLATMYPHRRY